MRIYIKRKIEKIYDKYIYLIFKLIYFSKNWFDEITINNLNFIKFKKN